MRKSKQTRTGTNEDKVRKALQGWKQVLGDNPASLLSLLPSNQFHQLTYRIAQETGLSYNVVSEILGGMA